MWRQGIWYLIQCVFSYFIESTLGVLAEITNTPGGNAIAIGPQ